MGKHSHITNCNHDRLKLCPKCDIVYCQICGKEWNYWPPYRIYQTQEAASITWTGYPTASTGTWDHDHDPDEDSE